MNKEDVVIINYNKQVKPKKWSGVVSCSDAGLRSGITANEGFCYHYTKNGIKTLCGCRVYLCAGWYKEEDNRKDNVDCKRCLRILNKVRGEDE